MEPCSIYRYDYLKIIHDVYLWSKKEIFISDLLKIESYKKEIVSSDVKNMAKIYKEAREFSYHLPGVFLRCQYKTEFKNGTLDRIKLKGHKLPFKIDNSDIYILGYYYYTIHLVVRTLLYFSSIEKMDFEHYVVEIKNSKCTQWLNKELGAGFTDGMLIDFSDRLYDQYKGTGITIEAFRNIFISMPHLIDEIGGTAFDKYMDVRNWREAWRFGLLDTLNKKMSLDESECSTIINYLLV